MAADAVYFIFLVPGLAMLAIAAWCVWAGSGHRAVRAFALLAFLEGLNFLLRATTTNVFEYPGTVRNYVFIALPFAVAYFGYAFLLQNRELAPQTWRWFPWALLAGAAFSLGAYAADHGTMASFDPGPPARNLYGPLQLTISLHFLALTVLSVIFLQAHVRQDGKKRHRAFFLAALGFAVLPAHVATYYVVEQVQSVLDGRSLAPVFYGSVLRSIETVVFIISPLILGVAWLRQHLALRESGRRALAADVSLYGRTLLAFCLIAGIARLWIGAQWGRYWILAHFVMLGLTALAFALLVGTAVLRHHALQIEHRASLAIRGGIVAYVFVAVMFVAVEIAAQRLTDEMSWGIGGVAAGVLLFALHPIQRFAERIANRTLPNAKRLSEMSREERLELYAEQAHIAWSDGKLEIKERLLLDRLRERLDLSVSEAAMLEKRAVA